MKLTCTECGKSTEVKPGATVAGLPVEEWFVTVQGKRCSPCFEAAGKAAKDAEIQERFERFHANNPHVLPAIVALGDELLAKGYEHFGIGMLWETLRYRHLTTNDPDSEFKLNDILRSRYSREIVRLYPRYEGVFDFRALRRA